ncbi:hypothetical protein E2K93_02815 [Thalassotalea sp. HSM 43]|uniref:putative Ig domain-containing protein n=1 Tax=Thalassotalea sp. HSM 43 TaxID=2552945 RepID=UPI0010809AFC|nr:putative Ig domain-containing protein [Thalassotalea sp. HSM 43]QBY03367.1 hypothetical protein E2K93_02815 [Thalassotalea sp. HSM 43]
MNTLFTRHKLAMLIAGSLTLTACGGGGGSGSGPEQKEPPTNTAPSISGAPESTSINELQAFSFTPSANDSDGDSLTFSINKTISWAEFDSATGTLAGTPTLADAGTIADIVISVSDGSASTDLAGFDLTVNNLVQISGRVLDGPISGALVYFDANNNNQHDDDELSVSSLEQGQFEFLLTAEQAGMYASANLNAYLGEGADDVSRQDDDFAATPITLSVSALGFDAATDAMSTTISPFSTLSAHGETQYLAQITSYLNVESSELMTDFSNSETLSSQQKQMISSRASLLVDHFQNKVLANSANLDTDNDGMVNAEDDDSDNDLVLDINDAFPLDKSASVDNDGDGLADFTVTFLNELTFTNDELKTCIVEQHGENATTASITDINCDGLINVDSITDLAYFSALESLTISNSYFTGSVNFSDFQHLPSIKQLSFAYSDGVDIADLYELEHLTSLDLSGQNIRTLDTITKLVNLEYLSVAKANFSDLVNELNPVADFTPMFSLPKLSKINLWDADFNYSHYKTLRERNVDIESKPILLEHINTSKKYIEDRGLTSVENNFNADNSGHTDNSDAISNFTWSVDSDGRLLVNYNQAGQLPMRYTWIGQQDLSQGAQLMVETGTSAYSVSRLVTLTPWLLDGNCLVGEQENGAGGCEELPDLGPTVNICLEAGLETEVLVRDPEAVVRNTFACTNVAANLCVESHRGLTGESNGKCCAFGKYPAAAAGELANGDDIAGSCCNAAGCNYVANGEYLEELSKQ